MDSADTDIPAGAVCEIRNDDLTRQLYATDASVYEVVPAAVAFPRSQAETVAALAAAADAGWSVTPRGAGTGLTGGALNEGLVLDLARHNRAIQNFDREARTIEVDAGVVLDQLNRCTAAAGLWFGPDVATSSRATLGGMIANNSSGAHVPVYGVTADHVESLTVVMADGRVHTVSRGAVTLPGLHEAVDAIARRYAQELEAHVNPEIIKRWAVYGLDRWRRQTPSLLDVIAGSEGTLAAILSAKLRLVPVPREKGLCLFFFDSVIEAMEAAVDLLDTRPAAVEHIDRVLFDQTRGQLAFAEARQLLELDTAPCEAILIVEYFDGAPDRLADLRARQFGRRKLIVTDPAEMQLVWDLRKAGLSLLSGCRGPRKPVPGIEDVAVPPRSLADYVRGLQEVFARLDLEGSFYGHAASGLLHVRPVLDLHQAEDIAKYRETAEEVAALTRQYKGSIAAEHGVGIARSEFLADQLGPELSAALAEIKRLFDPKGLFNPGKISGASPFQFDTHLRWGAGYDIRLPFEPVLRFAAKNERFVDNLEQCNGVGGCRKLTPSMCPTFLATGEELMSTRGRANILRASFDGRLGPGGREDASFYTPELDAALSNCVSCKACTSECPSNVNMTMLKAEVLHARNRQTGLSLRTRLVSRADLLGMLGCIAPAIANRASEWRWVRALLERFAGIAKDRPLPRYAPQRFDRWFNARRSKSAPGTRGTVVLWDDTFVRYHEPGIGRAAVQVLEAAGCTVVLPQGRQCCGRPAFSTGRLDRAAALGRHNVELLHRAYPDTPIVFLEPSCYSMVTDDYLDLGIEGAEALKARCHLFEAFLDTLLESAPDALRFRNGPGRVAIHAHCHAKALTHTGYMKPLAQRLPDTTAVLLDTACCGMAGQFGMLAEKQELSLAMGRLVLKQIEAQPEGTQLVASGTSCRQQLHHLRGTAPLHMAELLANALDNQDESAR